MMPELLLVSHTLCPYVQRAAIVLLEKNIPHRRHYVDLANKPDWFLKISPLAKTPVLVVNNKPLFESAVICEFLNEYFQLAMLPNTPIERARHRAWIAYSSSILDTIARLYSAEDAANLENQTLQLDKLIARLEKELDAVNYFSHSEFTLVDAAFAPAFRYFEVFREFYQHDFFAHTTKIDRWAGKLLAQQSVKNAVSSSYPKQLRNFVRNKRSELSRILNK